MKLILHYFSKYLVVLVLVLPLFILSTRSTSAVGGKNEQCFPDNTCSTGFKPYIGSNGYCSCLVDCGEVGTQGTCNAGYICSAVSQGCVTPDTYGAYEGKTCNAPSDCPSGYTCTAGPGSTCHDNSSGDSGVTNQIIQDANDWWNLGVTEWQIAATPKNDEEKYGFEMLHRASGHDILPLAAFEMVGYTPDAAVALNVPPGGGAMGKLASGIGNVMSQPPAHTGTYIADIGRQAGFVQTAYAQGTGWTTLQPVLMLWKAFRNMAYLAFVIIFVIIGFMIMFRAKIGQQAVMTIQLALPQIITTLLLITFSYAIAAFVIDLIYLLIYLAISLFSLAGVFTDGGEATRKLLLERNILQIAVGDLMGVFGNDAAGAAAGAVGNIVEGIFQGIGGQILKLFSQPLAYVIFAIAILVSAFRLFFKLLMAYVGIIFSVIFSPILLLANAIPGNNSFLKWLKGILANALLFPVTAVLLIIVAVLDGSVGFKTADIGYQSADFNRVALPFIGGGINSGNVLPLISLGMLMAMPNILDMIQKAMGVEGGAAGTVGSSIGGLFSPIGAFAGSVTGGIATHAGGQIAAGGAAGIRGLGSRIGHRFVGSREGRAGQDQGQSQQKIAGTGAILNQPSQSSASIQPPSGGIPRTNPNRRR